MAQTLLVSMGTMSGYGARAGRVREYQGTRPPWPARCTARAMPASTATASTTAVISTTVISTTVISTTVISTTRGASAAPSRQRHPGQPGRPAQAVPPVCVLGARPGEPRPRRGSGRPGAGKGSLGLLDPAGMGELREDRLRGRRAGRLCALRPADVRAAVAGLPDQPGERRRGAADDRAHHERVHRRRAGPDAGAGGGQGPHPARGQGDRGVRRHPLGGPVLRAARRLPAGRRVQDSPPALALPPAAAGAEDRGVLAGGRRGGAGTAAGLSEPGTGPPPRLTPRSPRAAREVSTRPRMSRR